MPRAAVMHPFLVEPLRVPPYGTEAFLMSIFVDSDTRLLVQGITEREGTFHAKQCLNEA
jgi:hypothetical protein